MWWSMIESAPPLSPPPLLPQAACQPTSYPLKDHKHQNILTLTSAVCESRGGRGGLLAQLLPSSSEVHFQDHASVKRRKKESMRNHENTSTAYCKQKSMAQLNRTITLPV